MSSREQMQADYNNIEMVGKTRLNLTWYSGTDLYSDGDIEEELLALVSEHERAEYDRLIAEKKSWPVLYHLSNLRGNILRQIPMNGTERVLEIGAGCGAVTGTLAAKAAKVDCVELSKRRSMINAQQNRGYDNIEIFVGNFETIEPELPADYDIVTLIGVFEYASYYLQAKDPFRAILKTAMAHVKTNGRLYIAIENRLGLKYFAGCREDHSGKFYEGIEGYPADAHAKTFSKKEWEDLLESCGYTDYTFFYPYPDYKLPIQIFSDERLPKPGELKRNLCNFDQTRLMTFNEDKVWQSILAEGLFPAFSNSFLIEVQAIRDSI